MRALLAVSEEADGKPQVRFGALSWGCARSGLLRMRAMCGRLRAGDQFDGTYVSMDELLTASQTDLRG
jgi:hypothetical protein